MPDTANPGQATETKACSGCGVSKPATTEFFYANESLSDGLSSKCKPCKRAYQREKYERDQEAKKEADRRYRLRQKGLEPEDYERLLESQDGTCAICDEPPKQIDRLCVDHNHDTGEVRGLLCRTCNQGIGLLGDAPEGVRSALQYLEEAHDG